MTKLELLFEENNAIELLDLYKTISKKSLLVKRPKAEVEKFSNILINSVNGDIRQLLSGNVVKSTFVYKNGYFGGEIEDLRELGKKEINFIKKVFSKTLPPNYGLSGVLYNPSILEKVLEKSSEEAVTNGVINIIFITCAINVLRSIEKILEDVNTDEITHLLLRPASFGKSGDNRDIHEIPDDKMEYMCNMLNMYEKQAYNNKARQTRLTSYCKRGFGARHKFAYDLIIDALVNAKLITRELEPGEYLKFLKESKTEIIKIESKTRNGIPEPKIVITNIGEYYFTRHLRYTNDYNEITFKCDITTIKKFFGV